MKKQTLVLILFCLCFVEKVTSTENTTAQINNLCQLEKSQTSLTCATPQTTIETFTKYLYTINATKIQHLNLSDCNITVLPRQFFKRHNLTNLVELKIINCNLNDIEEDAFYDLYQMKTLTLNGNNLRASLKQNQFNDLREVTALNLDNNQIERIPEYAFNGLNRVQKISLQFNNIKTLHKNFLQSSVHLTHVNLRNNGISSIETEAFGFISSLQEIDLSDNKINHLATGAFMGLKDIETLILKNASIRQIDPKTFINRRTLLVLDLSDNDIQNISTDTFYGLNNLRKLNLLNNKNVKSISKDSFIYLNKLEELRLPKYCYKKFLTEDFFNGLNDLKSLDLSHLNLTNLNSNLFNGLDNLELLNLSGNGIKNLDFDVFQKLPNLKILDISYNELNNMDIEMLVCTYNYMLKRMFVRRNPWDCQRLFKFLKHLELLDIKYDNEYFETPYIYCDNQMYKRDKPLILKGSRNIKVICQEIPKDRQVEHDVPSITTSVAVIEEKEIKTNIIIENIKDTKDLNSVSYYLQFNYVGAVLLMLVVLGFSFLLYHVIFVSNNRNNEDIVHGYMYSFSAPTTESKLNLVVDESVDSNIRSIP